jgi:hypothetical protein
MLALSIATGYLVRRGAYEGLTCRDLRSNRIGDPEVEMFVVIMHL